MIEFLYNGKKCYTDNLPKKLKRMKITESDIQILREFTEEKKVEKIEIDDSLRKIVYWDPKTKNSYITFIKIDEKPKSVNEHFKSVIYNEETKCGLREVNEDFLNRVYLLDGIPKYPIVLGNDNKPILEVKYDW